MKIDLYGEITAIDNRHIMSTHRIIEPSSESELIMTTFFLPIEATLAEMLLEAINKINTRHDGLACAVYQKLSDGQSEFAIYGLSSQVTEIAVEITQEAMEAKFKKHQVEATRQFILKSAPKTGIY